MKEIKCNYAENDYAVQDAMICSGVGEQHQKKFWCSQPSASKNQSVCAAELSAIL